MRDFALARCAFLLPLLKFWNDNTQHLHDDACSDVRHDAESENREAAEGTAREQVEKAQRALRVGGLTQLPNGLRIDTWHAKRRTKTVNRDHCQGEQHLVAKVDHLEDVLHIRQHRCDSSEGLNTG